MDKAHKIKNIKNILLILAAISLGILGYFNYSLSARLNSASVKIDNQKLTIESLEIDKSNLETELQTEKDKVLLMSEQVEDLTDDVDLLNKLTETDEELLQKYSKVSFLNEHYVPSTLREVGERYTYNEKEVEVHSRILTNLRRMIRAGDEDDVSLKIVSGYRSFGTQSELKSSYLVTYGTGANAFSADQGFSEHQLGTTVDFSTESINGALTVDFEDTPEYKWLTKNAHKYGFTLSYPEGNKYYQFEPWHWRFVGEDLANYLHEENKHFYDLEQREIDKYLIKIFDY